MAAHKAMYPTLDAYYAADERRLRSEEADYGVHWRLDGKDDVADFIAWLENPGDVNTPQQPAVNTDPLQARIPAARPELTQAPEWDWEEESATDAQLGYLHSLLRREGLFLGDRDAASMTKGQASHIIDLLTAGQS